MLKSEEVRRQVAQRLRELLPRAKGWQESADAKIGGQVADLLARFQLAGQEHTLVVEVTPLGQPRQIRAAVTRLNEIRREIPGAYPVAAAVYIGPQSASILKSNNLGFVDLSGNCYLAFENALVEKEGKRNVRPSTRPLRSLFAPRATRVVRVLLVEPGRAWRLEELGRAAEVSLGHSYNVVKRLEELAWVERDDSQRIRLSKAADLLLAPSLRLPAVHCYLEGDPAPVAQALGLRPTGEADGALHFFAPYDLGVFYGAFEKGGLKVVCLPQLYADLVHYEHRGPEQAEHLRREAMGY